MSTIKARSFQDQCERFSGGTGTAVLFHVAGDGHYDYIWLLYEENEDIESSVRNIEIFDTGIAFLAGLMIVPAVFVFSGGDQASLKAGPTLMFITLPKVFDSMAGGHLIGTVFLCWYCLLH